MLQTMSKILLWLSGANERVLEQCPTERLKLLATGGVVITAAGLAMLSAVFTLHNFVGVALAPALIVGFAWGLAIMNFDRWLLMSIRRQRTWYFTILMALPRLFLAVIVGLVIAQPLLLRVFETEISHQVKLDKGQQLAQAKALVEREKPKIDGLRARQKTLETALSNPNNDEDLTENAQYAQLNSQLSTLLHREAVAQSRASCELDGSCGSKHRGEGPAYQHKLHLAEKVKAEANEVKRQMTTLRRQILTSESAHAPERANKNKLHLGEVDKELSRLEGQRRAQEAEYIRDYHAKAGLLDRVEALSALGKAHPSIHRIEILLWLLILAIDSMPAFAKTIMSLGKESLYEQVLDRTEADALSAVEEEHKANVTSHRIAATTIVKAAEARQQLEVEARRQLTEQTVEAQKTVAERFISIWEESMLPFATSWAERWIDAFQRSVDRESAELAEEGSLGGQPPNGHGGGRPDPSGWTVN